MPEIFDQLSRIVVEVVEPNAESVDEDCRFPEESLASLRSNGFLGLVSKVDLGGGGHGIDVACVVVERLASVCGSTAMVLLTHLSAAGLLEQVADLDVRRAVARGECLCSLALLDKETTAELWTPTGSARRSAGGIVLTGEKAHVGFGGKADLLVWSSRSTAGANASLWGVQATPDMAQRGSFDRLGLRGVEPRDISLDNFVVGEDAGLGQDGHGLDLLLSALYPAYMVLFASLILGLLEGLVDEILSVATRTSPDGGPQVLEFLAGSSRVEIEKLRSLVLGTVRSLMGGEPDAAILVMSVKVGAHHAADAVMKVLDVLDERLLWVGPKIARSLRDLLTARTIHPTSEVLSTFVGRSMLGRPLF